MIRKNNPADRRFIVNSWLRSYAESNMSGILPVAVYWSVHEPLVDALLDLPDTQILVYCNPEDENQIFGWVAFSSTHLYYVYVKQPYRGSTVAPKIALQLVQATGLSLDPLKYVFNTKVFGCFLRKHGLQGKWTPAVIKDCWTLESFVEGAKQV